VDKYGIYKCSISNSVCNGCSKVFFGLSKELTKINNNLIFLVHSKEAILDKSLFKNFNIKEVKGGSGHFW